MLSIDYVCQFDGLCMKTDGCVPKPFTSLELENVNGFTSSLLGGKKISGLVIGLTVTMSGLVIGPKSLVYLPIWLTSDSN